MSNEENTDCVLYNSLFSQLEGLSFKPLYSSTKRNAFLTGVTVDGDKEVVCVCVCVFKDFARIYFNQKLCCLNAFI